MNTAHLAGKWKTKNAHTHQKIKKRNYKKKNKNQNKTPPASNFKPAQYKLLLGQSIWNLVRWKKLFWIDVLQQKIKTSKAMQIIFWLS